MTFNPLKQLAQRKAKKAEDMASLQQSVEPAPEPAPPQEFDTYTPATTDKTPRRFDLGDLPRYGNSLYPYLKKAFPHLHERMYSGWLRGCIQDNSCHFVAIDGTVAMAFVEREAVNPIPFVDIKFVFGLPEDFHIVYEDIVRWGKNLGVSEIRQQQYSTADLATYLPNLTLEERTVTIIKLG